MFFIGKNRHGDYPKTSNGTLTLDAADANIAQNVLIEVICTETFAAGDGAKPTFKIGETGTTNKFADTTAFSGMTEGDRKVFSGTLTATKALIVTATAATGTTSAGAIKVRAVVMKQTPI